MLSAVRTQPIVTFTLYLAPLKSPYTYIYFLRISKPPACSPCFRPFFSRSASLRPSGFFINAFFGILLILVLCMDSSQFLRHSSVTLLTSEPFNLFPTDAVCDVVLPHTIKVVQFSHVFLHVFRCQITTHRPHYHPTNLLLLL